MWIQANIKKNSSGIRHEESFDTEVEQIEHDIHVTFRFDRKDQEGGTLCINRETARWLAYALLATSEPAMNVEHLIMRVEKNKVVSSGPVPKARKRPRSDAS